jgi:transposase
MQSYSQDLRERVLRALDRGEGPSAIARRYEVSRFYVYQVRDRAQETGVRTSLQIGGHRRSRQELAESALRGWIAAEPGLTLAELQQRLASQCISIKIGALWHQLNKWNLTFKKTLHAAHGLKRGRGWTLNGLCLLTKRGPRPI